MIASHYVLVRRLAIALYWSPIHAIWAAKIITQSAGQLAVIATPIGNLGDLSPRAAEWLQKADILACEDTRMTRKLLTLTGLRTAAKFMPYHDHNGKTMRPKLLEALQSGKIIALVSDAGTPLVSDPG